MLAGLLREDPSAGHLASLLEQLVYWAQVDWEAPRHRSIKVILDLLGAMRELPSINILEGDGLGSLVVQLAVSLADPEESIREKAREVMSQLLTMLLRRRGLRGKRPRLVWAQDAQRPWRASCFDLVSIYELFWNHLSIGQQSSFREAALQHALLLLGRKWAREAGLILLYSSIGQARPLLEEQDEDYLKGDLAHLLYNLQMGRSPLKPQLCAGKEGSSCCCCWVCSRLPSSDPAQTERQGTMEVRADGEKKGAVCRKGRL